MKKEARAAYVRSKLSVLLPAQIRALRLRRGKSQTEFGHDAEMKQARISALERIGAANFSVETLIQLASAFKVGLVIKFVPFSEMLQWENSFEADTFNVVSIEQDRAFIEPATCDSTVSTQIKTVEYPPRYSMNGMQFFNQPLNSGLTNVNEPSPLLYSNTETFQPVEVQN